MKRLIIITLGISLMAAACNKPVAVIETPSTTANVEKVEVAQAPVQSDTPTTQQPVTPKTTFKAVGTLVPKTEDEQDFQIDQNTIKNVEQDSRLDNLETPVVVPTPTPAPLPTPPPDLVAPKVSLKRTLDTWTSAGSPIVKNGGLYSTIGLATDVFDDGSGSSGLAKIEYYLDGELLLSSTDKTGDSILAWDTTKYSNGEHQLTLRVYDNAGNFGSDSASITIKN